MKIRGFFKRLTQAIFVDFFNTLRGETRKDLQADGHKSQYSRLHLAGNYTSWSEALADSTGYDAEIILKSAKDALLRVRKGEAVYERDTVLFDEIQYSWPLLAGLMWAAADTGGALNVLDFGGSLGSTYFQNRAFLAGLREVRWNIVEQALQVAVGKECFEDDQLKFYPDVDACTAATKPHVILLCSVLQYLPDPYDRLDQLLSLPCEHLIIDRTPFWDGSTDRLCVQHVPSKIYSASYPSWIFSAEQFRSHFAANWELMAEFDNPDRLPGPIPFAYRGMILHRRNAT
ncbi:MAG: methyltransferase, TIGR04325 family [Chloroflexota bacterium]